MCSQKANKTQMLHIKRNNRRYEGSININIKLDKKMNEKKKLIQFGPIKSEVKHLNDNLLVEKMSKKN